MTLYDIAIIGGGINGAGIARDAAGRGLSVLLCEKDDLAAHTSSASTKLIHGGLRYLEHYEFGLVRKALLERERLMRVAPHIIRPLRFVMPHDAAQRPAWLIRAGLFLYDHLAQRRMLPGSSRVALARHPAGGPLRAGFAHGFEYSDGWVDDARLVVLCAMDAAARGARVHTRCAVTGARREGDAWTLTVEQAGARRAVRARALVNAAGPWAHAVARQAAPDAPARRLRLVKGSHIVVPRLFAHEYAYIFQHADGRIVFAIPYEGAYTLIGTTDVDHPGDPDTVAIDAAEIDYLCGVVNHYFARGVTPADVVWTYAGVRPLLEDEHAAASEVTRDYQLVLDADAGAPLLSVFGGKITTFRRLAEDALEQLAPRLGNRAPAWTETAPLPGGDIPPRSAGSRAPDGFSAFVRERQAALPWLPARLVARYARAYGTRIDRLLAGRRSLADMGEEVLPSLHAAEIDYLIDHEWARSATDILWRRSKLGLHLTADAAATLDGWLARRRHAQVSRPLEIHP